MRSVTKRGNGCWVDTNHARCKIVLLQWNFLKVNTDIQDIVLSLLNFTFSQYIVLPYIKNFVFLVHEKYLAWTNIFYNLYYLSVC
jgi:hypothetical protein